VTDFDLLSAINKLTKSLKDVHIDILLVPWGQLKGPLWDEALEQIAKDAIVVLPAGNVANGELPLTADLRKLVLVAASVNLNGERSTFTAEGPDCFWSPGEDVPLLATKVCPVRLSPRQPPRRLLPGCSRRNLI
jgi:hypothetical protein